MKIIHIADVHLGAEPDIGCSWSEQRKTDIWESFRKVIDRCRKENTDLLLIAGDLFHRPPLKRELKEVNSYFRSIPKTTVVLVAGNHDYLRRGGFFDDYSWNDNVVVLMSHTCEKVEISKLNLAVYGCSYYEREVPEPLYDDIEPSGLCRYHILVAHGGDATHSPIDRRRLINAGFDYVALGHIHKPEIIAKNRIAYSGSLEPIDCNDFGSHGYMEVILEKDNIQACFVPAAVCEYKVMDLVVDETNTQYDLEQLLAGHLAKEAGNRNIFHAHLSGIRDRSVEFDLERLKNLGRVVRVRDDTHPYYDLDELSRIYEGSLIGEFIKRMRDLDDSASEKALYYGLDALLDNC